MGTGLLTAEGFDPKRLDDILAGLKAAMRDELGQSLNLDADSPEGKIVSVVANELLLLWERAEEMYAAQSPSNATAVSLDRLAEITAITRNPATRSVGDVFCRGNLATIPSGSLLEVVDAAHQFRTTAALSLPAENKLADCAAGGILVQTAGVATQTWVSHGLDVGDYVWYVGVDQAEYNGIKTVLTTPTADTFTFAVDSGATSPATGTVASTVYQSYTVGVESTSTGPIPALSGTLTEIVSAVSGWDAVVNALDADVGANEESDTEFRIRRIAALNGLGNATVPSIQGDLVALEAVTVAIVFENRTDSTVGGRPPHTIECLVEGGTDADIAQAIWESKGAGINTHGSSSAVIVDSQGTNQTMYFSRPTGINIYLDITLTVDSDYPADGDAQVEAAVLAWAEANLEIGDDVIVYPYLVSSFGAVPGIITTVIDIGTSISPSGDANITIAETERAQFDTSRTTVAS